MRRKPFGWIKRISLRPGAAAGLGVLIFLDPAGLIWMFLAAAALHEAAHLLCLWVCGVPLRRLRIGLFGTELETGPRSGPQELCCAAAGPAANLVCAFLAAGPFARLSLLLAVYNLLPVYPLDGGRMLRVLLPRQAGAVSAAVQALLLCAACLACACGRLGLWPLGLAALIFGKTAVCAAREQKFVANTAAGLYNNGRKQKLR